MAIGVVSICWLATPTEAAAEQPPALDGSGLAQEATGAASGVAASIGAISEGAVAAAPPAGGPAQDVATQVTGTVARVTGPSGPVAHAGTRTAAATGSVAKRLTTAAAPVAGAADRVVDRVNREVPPAVETVVHRATRAADSVRVDERRAGELAGLVQRETSRGRLPGQAAGEKSTASMAGTGSALLGAPADGESSRAATLRLGEADHLASSGERALGGSLGFPTVTAFPLLSPSTTALPGVPQRAGSVVRGTAPAALNLPSAPDPLSGAVGGSSALGASSSLSLGGLALLLAALCLAGPALRRRLPRRPVIGWPAAFVPLLERPG